MVAAVRGQLTEEWRDKYGISLTDWVHHTVGEISIVATGKTPSRKEPKYWQDGDIPWLTSKSTGSVYTESAEQFVTQFAVEDCSLKVFPPGTLLLAMYGEGKTRGQVTELRLAATCNQACAAVTADEKKILGSYLKLRLLENYEETRKAAAGGAQPNLNLNKVRAIGIDVPTKREQAEIVRQVDQLFAHADRIEQQVNNALARVNSLTQSILAKAFRGELTEQWRSDNAELISGENSAEALLAKIKGECEALGKKSKPSRAVVKRKTGSSMNKQIINVAEALKKANKPLSGQQLLAAAGYPSDSSTADLETFFLDIRKAINQEKSIVKLKRSDDGQDWFSLIEATTDE
nr:restriction endonuclease subunit S [Halomonas utahensis]